MPKLTEVERLFTSDSYGGRVKSAEKRKYHQETQLTIASTRAKTRKMEGAASALISVSNFVRDDIAHCSEQEFPEECTEEFLEIPDDLDVSDKDLVPNETDKLLNGNRIVDIKKLDNM